MLENKDDKDKPKYAFWGGNEENSEIIRKVYNNNFDELPVSLREQLNKTGKNNLRGDIVKILLTTKTGAEGIDLHNVRQVHIIEPYWNPVRTKQVEGRAVRVGSHKQLPAKERTVEIYRYLSVIKKEDLESDKVIEDDSEGLSSDQVLFKISNTKLEIMNDLLRLIKEASIDCSSNLEETLDETNKFKCLSFGSNVSRNEYSYIPNIKAEYEDSEKKRRIKKTKWMPQFFTMKIKGVMMKFAFKEAPEGEPNLMFDAESTKSGQPGDAIGEFTIIESENAEGNKVKKRKIKFYKN